MTAEPVATFVIDTLTVRVYEDRAALGRAAAEAVARGIESRQAQTGVARVVFAAAPSQNEFLAALVTHQGMDWSKLVAFHMDEYLGLPADHPAAFRRYLRDHLFAPAGLAADRLRLIPGEDTDRPTRTCLAYEDLLRAEPPDLICGGIGENGHLAFNDPPADFADPVLVKVARLDASCRQQQVNDGCFPDLASVPTHAYTLTLTALLSARSLSVVVPGPRKAEAVRAALLDPISESCPASALRRHPSAMLYLDRDSARLVIGQ